MLDEGWSVAAASQAAGVSKRTGFKWLARFKAEGPQGLADRSSRPRRCPLALTPQEQRQLEELRRQRWPLWRIAQQARRGMGTVSRYMKRLGLSRLVAAAARAGRALRTCHARRAAAPGHRSSGIDGVGHRITGDRTLNRNRGIGWDMVHPAIDDHSRVSFALIKTDERARTVRSSCTRRWRTTPAWAYASTAS